MRHNGCKETLNKLRQNYWILRGRNSVKVVLRKCRVCKMFEGKPYVYPNTPHLPKERLCDVRAFACIGIDYAGPILFKILMKMILRCTNVG